MSSENYGDIFHFVTITKQKQTVEALHWLTETCLSPSRKSKQHFPSSNLVLSSAISLVRVTFRLQQHAAVLIVSLFQQSHFGRNTFIIKRFRSSLLRHCNENEIHCNTTYGGGGCCMLLPVALKQKITPYRFRGCVNSYGLVWFLGEFQYRIWVSIIKLAFCQDIWKPWSLKDPSDVRP